MHARTMLSSTAKEYNCEVSISSIRYIDHILLHSVYNLPFQGGQLAHNHPHAPQFRSVRHVSVLVKADPSLFHHGRVPAYIARLSGLKIPNLTEVSHPIVLTRAFINVRTQHVFASQHRRCQPTSWRFLARNIFLWWRRRGFRKIRP